MADSNQAIQNALDDIEVEAHFAEQDGNEADADRLRENVKIIREELEK